ncbi:hypothetical protein P171DRAFT_487795 [Karstenula rhodostoma CBS 690.94]|uniref:Uncharacterized protein n=1 Tax=Karstenula rhodostoma CBS 690.94 TaxID=1392251 RepID=A0A9P4UA07_9PLEO|nr:hypothetical protein P171DRAFT_487795 [Karstenula rhodostoma CBS 690.94]
MPSMSTPTVSTGSPLSTTADLVGRFPEPSRANVTLDAQFLYPIPPVRGMTWLPSFLLTNNTLPALFAVTLTNMLYPQTCEESLHYDSECGGTGGSGAGGGGIEKALCLRYMDGVSSSFLQYSIVQCVFKICCNQLPA